MARQAPVIIDSFSYASPSLRMMAFLIDYTIALLLILIPIIGFTLSFFYLLFKDAIPLFTDKSIGKKILGIRVVKEGKFKISAITALKRNIFFLPNALLIIFSFKVIYIVLILNVIAIFIESYNLYIFY